MYTLFLLVWGLWVFYGYQTRPFINYGLGFVGDLAEGIC